MLIISVYWPYQIKVEYKKQIYEANTKLYMLEVEQQHYAIMSDLKSISIESLLHDYKSELEKNKKQHKEPMNEALKTMESKILEFKDVSNKTVELKSINEHLKDLESALYNIERNANIFKIVGTFLSIIGFLMWYFKIQIYQDMILKNSSFQTKEPNTKMKADD